MLKKKKGIFLALANPFLASQLGLAQIGETRLHISGV